MSRSLPHEGTNLLTEQLIADGCDPKDSGTWPENAYSPDGERFVYKMDWQYRQEMIWESPCGLMAQGPGQTFGDLHLNGTYHCVENGNSLFQCPHPGTKCPHRLALPKGINCQFHRTDKPYDPERGIEWIERQQILRLHKLYIDDLRSHPGYQVMCNNAEERTDENGRAYYAYKWRLFRCGGCPNEECPARNWAKRDISPVNIFYDLYIERQYLGELTPRSEKSLRKGLKVFDRAIAKTDAELFLQIWEHDPYSWQLPPMAMAKLNPLSGLERTEAFFIEHHGQFQGRRYKVFAEVRNVHIAKFEQRDIMADLQAVRDGIEVTHESDSIARAKNEKKERRRAAEVEKMAKRYANAKEGSRMLIMTGYLPGKNDSKAVRERKEAMRRDIMKRAEEFMAKERLKKEREMAKEGQISLFE